MEANNDNNALNTQIQYKMIEKLSAMNKSLKDEISERKKAQETLTVTNHQLEKALKVKSEFLSTMSHEIRTPLNLIIGYTQLMLKAQFIQKEQDHVNSIKFAADSLLNIVDQILQYSRLDSENTELFEEEFNIHEIGTQFAQVFNEQAKEKALKFTLNIDPLIPHCFFGDVKKLQQIIYNIVGNAFKFTEKGGIIFKAELASNNNDQYWIKFVVQDTGIGMDKTEIATIFERFRQVQTNIKREFGGVGLGLAISKKLAEVMNGEMIAESEKNVGSTFTFTLPFKQMDASVILYDNATAINVDTPLKNVNVLLVEDELFNQAMAIEYLEGLGCTVKTALNGEEAYQQAKRYAFDVILMDLHMPVLDGFEATKKIIGAGITTPILGFTADILAETRKKVVAAGMQGVIPKPFTIKELVTSIKQAILKSKGLRVA